VPHIERQAKHMDSAAERSRRNNWGNHSAHPGRESLQESRPLRWSLRNSERNMFPARRIPPGIRSGMTDRMVSDRLLPPHGPEPETEIRDGCSSSGTANETGQCQDVTPEATHGHFLNRLARTTTAITAPPMYSSEVVLDAVSPAALGC
jgi:hypothetical protein